MTFDIWTAFAISFAAFCCIEALLFIRRRHAFINSKALLIQAKQETKVIAQLPLNNPHPQIQISENGQILFTNPATLFLFPDLQEQGLDHPILQGIQGADERELNFNGKIYHQTVSEILANNEKAYAVYCFDITERKNYEHSLKKAQNHAEKMQQSAEAAKEARSEFLANMSHELRTPMNGIIGLSDLLVEAGLEGEKQNLIQAVNSSARNLLILLNDILDFSKIEAGEITIEKIPFNIFNITKQIELLQSPVAAQKGLIMQTEIAADVPEYLIGDPSRLQQILNNLVSNALKFTSKGSVKLRLSYKADKNEIYTVKFEIIDTGIGIPKSKQAKIFEKFQQADASTSRKYGGTGLGLSITKDLTELMGGVIAIESEEGVGTTFTVTIPMQIAKQQSTETLKQSNQTTSINTKAKVLVVDDHPINLLFLNQTLKQIGFKNFDEAANGKEALEYFKNNTYDVIIMDCQMPEMDGFETSQKIREIEHAETAPVIIAATADAMKGAEERCIASGMDDYISKPIDKEKLRTMLQQWIPNNEDEIQDEMDAETASISISQQQIDDTMTIINLQKLTEFTNGDKEAEAQIIKILLDNLENDMASLKQALKDNNYKEWDSWAHKIYGACSHIGANRLAKICDEGQTLFPDKIEKIPETHSQIIHEYQYLETFLKEYQAA